MEDKRTSKKYKNQQKPVEPARKSKRIANNSKSSEEDEVLKKKRGAENYNSEALRESKRRKDKEESPKEEEPVLPKKKKSKETMSQPAPKKSAKRKEKKREKKQAEKEKRQQEEASLEEKLEQFESTLLQEEKILQKMNETSSPEASPKNPNPNPSPSNSNPDALRGLLNKLASPNDAFAPNPLSRSKLNILITGLKDEGNEAMQLQSLMELCDFLSIGTEENMANFALDSFVPLLVNLLNMEHNPDIMLLACRSLAYLMEALPAASGTLVAHQAVPALCSKLLSIEYIDLAEQALQCLEKISYDNPVPLLKAGALNAVLMFLDFFPSGTQRSALTTAANICRQISPESFDNVVDAIPILTNLLQYQDAKLVEKTIICFSRLSDCLQGTDKLEELTKYGLVSNLVRLIASNTGLLSPATLTLLIRLLTSMCMGSPAIVRTLLQDGEGVISVIQNILASGSGTDASTISPDQFYEILSLINELLPPLPKEVTMFLSSARPVTSLNSLGLGGKPFGRVARKPVPSKKEETKEEESEDEEEETEESEEAPKPKEVKKPVTKAEKHDSRAQLIQDNPGLLINFGERLLFPLLQVFNSSVSYAVRHKCLLVVTKIIYFSTADMLRELLRNITVSSFIANMLTSTDISIVATALKISEFLMEKLPEIFDKYFKREGVVYEVDRLSQLPEKTAPSTNQNNTVFTDPNSGISTNIADIEAWVRDHASKFKAKYFGKGSLDEANVSDLLRDLKAAVAKLQKHMSPVRPDSNDKELLEQLASLISAEESVSTFEFLRSGLTEVLLAYLTSTASTDDKSGILVQRANLFCNVFLRGSGKVDKEKANPFTILVQKLHHAVNKLEKFPVVLNEMSGTAQGIKYLTQPLKLKLQKAADLSDASIKDYSENVVLIEPLATVNAVIDFLSSRVRVEASKEKKEETLESMEVEESKSEAMDTAQKTEFLDDYEDEEQDDDDEDEQDFQPAELVHDVQLEKLSSSTSSLRDSQSKVDQSTKFVLTANGVPLLPTSTIFQALQTIMRKQDGSSDEANVPQPIYRLWETVHTLTYSVVPVTTETAATTSTEVASQLLDEVPYIQFLNDEFKLMADSTDSVHSILSLLRVLHELNWMWGPLNSDNKTLAKKFITSPTDFVNNKLSAKLMRQLQDLLTLCSGALPEWAKKLPLTCSFLFPFDTRKLYFNCTSFGIARALQALQQHLQGSNSVRNTEIRIGRIQRQKVRISRERLLDSALKVMELYGKSKAILEVEYFGEVGTGLGPTLEFYTLVSQELQRKDLNMWRDDKPIKKGDAMEVEGKLSEEELTTRKYVHTAGGLFPIATRLGTDADSKRILDLFKFCGTFMAKALLDNRLLDLPLSSAFLKWMTKKELTFYDLKAVDLDLASSLEKLINLNKEVQAINRKSGLSSAERKAQIEALRIGGASVEDLDLDFTLPGQPNWELKPNGANIPVTVHNLEEYLNLVVDHHLRIGVSAQLDAFKKGFNEVFPMNNLSVFTIDELESLLCGRQEAPWDLQTLLENTRCDHGYSHNSQTVKDLLEAMTEFTADERRQFLLFVTGSPRLPLGGFRSLDPKLTIVRKEHGREGPDSHLPSVNCCFYYLKLPEYSSKKALKEKLMFAIEHGQGSFSFN